MGITMNTPRAYGLFHIAWLALIAVLAVALVRWLASDKTSERTFRSALFVIWITLIIFDLYKQITFDLIHVDASGNVIVDYQWYAFPFQLCSTPHYVLPFVIFMKDSRARDAFVGFLAFFSFVGGMFVLIIPESCFTDRLFVNIQTMLHHGMQIILALLLAFRYKSKLRIAMYRDSALVFISFVGIALALNIFMNLTFGDAVYGFNMFYIGPFHLSVMPALSWLSTAVPYPVFLLGYIVLVSLAAYLAYHLLRAISAISEREKSKETAIEQKQENNER